MATKRQKGQKLNRNRNNPFSSETTNSNSFFMKPSDSTEEQHEKEKKPFDKHKWRLQKYSMKHKIENWENKRSKAIIRRYQKEKKHDKGSRFDVNRIYEEEEERIGTDEIRKDNKSDAKPKNYRSISEQLRQKQEEKTKKKEDLLKIKTERDEALKRYKQKKIEKYKKLNKKTKKGQPIMKGRIEYLLEKIQNNIDK